IQVTVAVAVEVGESGSGPAKLVLCRRVMRESWAFVAETAGAIVVENTHRSAVIDVIAGDIDIDDIDVAIVIDISDRHSVSEASVIESRCAGVDYKSPGAVVEK